MSEEEKTEIEKTEDVEESEADRLQSEAAAAVSIDLPRMVRSDATRVTEMIAKYRGIGGAESVLAYLLDARAALLSFSPARAVAFVGGGAEFVREGEIPLEGQRALRHTVERGRVPQAAPVPVEPPKAGVSLTYTSGGRDVLLTETLVRLGVLSSTVRAKSAIRDGIITVNGKPATPTQLLAPGRAYQVAVGDDGWQGEIVIDRLIG